MLYPKKTHSIAGGTTRLHLFRMLTRFVEENLAVETAELSAAQ
jgi:dipeptidyl-peptidase-4